MMKLDNEREIARKKRRDLNKLCDAKAIKREREREREIEPSRRKRRE